MRTTKLYVTLVVMMVAVAMGVVMTPTASADTGNGMFPVKIEKVASPAGTVCVRYRLQPVETEVMHLRINVDNAKMRVISIKWRKPVVGSVGWNEQFGGGRTQSAVHTATICARYRWKRGPRAKRARVVATYFFSEGGYQSHPFIVRR